jgi:hypothetical protein
VPGLFLVQRVLGPEKTERIPTVPTNSAAQWKYYVNRLRYATLANLSTQGPMNTHERRYVTIAITLIDAMGHNACWYPENEKEVDTKESRRDSPVKIQGGG